MNLKEKAKQKVKVKSRFRIAAEIRGVDGKQINTFEYQARCENNPKGAQHNSH